MMVSCVNRTRTRIHCREIESTARRIAAILKRSGFWRVGRYALTIAFVTDAESGSLNRMFRNKRKPANILSFDYGSFGELVLAPSVIRNEAQAYGETLMDRYTTLIIHGMVHLAGIHHERSEAAQKKSVRLEETIAGRLGARRAARSYSLRAPGRGKA